MTFEKPLVTIAMPLFNYERYVREALESALAQDYEPLEILVLDNRSTDKSLDIVREYQADERLRIVQHERNIGMIGNHNAGWQMAAGDYVVFLSADDIMLPGHVSRIMSYLRDHPHIDLVYTPYYLMDSESRLYPLRHPGWPDLQQYEGRLELPEMLKHDNFMTMPSLVAPKRFFEEAGGFDPAFKVAGDFNLEMAWLQSGKKCAYLDVRSVAVRHHGENLSTDSYISSGLQVEEHVEILDRYVTEKNGDALAGREAGVRFMLQAKMGNLKPFPEKYAEVMARCAEKIARIDARLEGIRHRRRAVTKEYPRVSVICTTLGRPEYLERAMRSLVAQTYGAWECVIVGDGGINAEAVIGRIADARLRYVRKINTAGPGAARNAAMSLVRGEVIAYLDEDNLYSPTHLESVVAAIDGGAAVAITAADLVVETVPVPNGVGGLLEIFREPLYALETGDEVLHRNGAALNAFAHRFACIDSSGGFNENLPLLEDWEFEIRLLLNNRGSVRYLTSSTVEVRSRLGFSDQLLRQRWGQYGPSLQGIFDAYKHHVDPAVIASWRKQIDRVASVQQLMANPDSATASIARLLCGRDV